MRSPGAANSPGWIFFLFGGGAAVEAAAAAFKLMSTCLLAGRTNSAHTAKVRAQRNLRAALQTLT